MDELAEQEAAKRLLGESRAGIIAEGDQPIDPSTYGLLDEAEPRLTGEACRSPRCAIGWLSWAADDGVISWNEEQLHGDVEVPGYAAALVALQNTMPMPANFERVGLTVDPALPATQVEGCLFAMDDALWDEFRAQGLEPSDSDTFALQRKQLGERVVAWWDDAIANLDLVAA